jgi:hypothetical protein
LNFGPRPLLPSMTVGPGAPTGAPPAAVPALTPNQQRLLTAPYTSMNFGPRPTTAAPLQGVTIPMQTGPSRIVGAGDVPGAAPGQILPGDQVISGRPLYGIQPGDDVQTVIRKAWQNGNVMITTPQQLAAVQHPPVVVMRTGNADGSNGLDPGEQVRISYDPETGKPTVDLLKQGQPANYAVDQANKLREDFTKNVDEQNYLKARGQVVGAFSALQQNRETDPTSKQNPDWIAAPATQMQLMHAMWQLMNPSATVRQGSIQASEQDPRLTEWWTRLSNRFSTGGTLTAQEQKELIYNIENAYKGAQIVHNETVDDVRNRARLFNIKSDLWDTIATKDTAPTRFAAWDKANPYVSDSTGGAGSTGGTGGVGGNPLQSSANPYYGGGKAAPPPPGLGGSMPDITASPSGATAPAPAAAAPGVTTPAAPAGYHFERDPGGTVVLRPDGRR